MKKFYTFLTIYLLGVYSLSAGVRNSTGSGGSWNVASNWSPAVVPASNPTSNTDVININNKITYNGPFTLGPQTVLNIKAGDTLIINGDVTFNNTSVLTLSAGGVLIINGNVDNKNNSNEISISGLLSITGNYNGGNGSAIIGTGSMNITGTVSTAGSGTVFGSTMNCLIPGACSSSFSSPLPIKLISFDAISNGNKVDLKWLTATEINNDFFTIEKSSDLNNWDVVSVTKGAGNSNNNIEYFDTDFSPYDGISYYRLKQTDFDGAYTYSNMVPVKYEKKLNLDMSLFPNPIERGQQLNIQFKETQNSEVLIVIRDGKGEEFYSKAILHSEDGLLIAVPLNKDIPAGFYIVTATSENQIYSQKLLIK